MPPCDTLACATLTVRKSLEMNRRVLSIVFRSAHHPKHSETGCAQFDVVADGCTQHFCQRPHTSLLTSAVDLLGGHVSQARVLSSKPLVRCADFYWIHHCSWYSDAEAQLTVMKDELPSARTSMFTSLLDGPLSVTSRFLSHLLG